MILTENRIIHIIQLQEVYYIYNTVVRRRGIIQVDSI